ncbi:hypothetical protein [Paraburkholderia sp.]|uniref:hypothetical protein n=1 Tax=Paraburkholderia sp. TaxID=1926495 RepID=UPI0025F3417D|nr:hypothetical protein [Paraburkholderia sp.]
MTNKSKMLSDVVHAAGRYTRSVSIVRDYFDPSALNGYIVTPTVNEVLARVGESLRGKAVQRAWKIIGPYGSGKSALGLFIAHLVNGKTREAKQALQILRAANASTASIYSPSLNLLPIFVSGTRGAFVYEVAKALSATGARVSSLGKLDLQAGTYRKESLAVAFPRLVADFAADVQKAGYAGTLFVVDEMGKFIEYASLNPEAGDLYAFQQLAEMTCGTGTENISVLAMQHQQFEDYANAVGRTLSDEWGKVSSRFEDIVFEEPLEQCATLMADTLIQDVSSLTKLGIPAASKLLYKEYFKRQRIGGVSDEAAETLGPRLYPLHPAALIAIAYISKRLGQSERSIFAFLNGSEPFGFGDFTRHTTASKDNWFRLSNLFDYLVSGGALRFRHLEASRRWEYTLARIHASVSLSERQIDVVKTIALEECFGPFSQSGLTAEGLMLTIGAANGGAMAEELDALVDMGILLRRQSTGEYVLQTDRELNIEALYQEAMHSVNRHAAAINGLRDIIARARTVAHRHYQSTGTLRTARTTICQFGDVDSLPNVADTSDADGEVVLILCDSKQFCANPEKALKKPQLQDRFRMVRFVLADEKTMEHLFQFACWNSVYAGISRRQVDPWGIRFVEQQLSAARRYIEVTLVSQLEADSFKICSPWYYGGEEIKSSDALNASQVCSIVFDKLYSDTPVLKNELINRRKLSSAIVLARQRLIEMALANPKDAIFSIDGYPPERLIYASIAAASGLHRGGDGFQSLDAIDKSWKPVFSLIYERLQGLGRVNVQDLIAELAAPPIGLRNGPAAVVISLYIVGFQQSIALFERNTFIAVVTIEHFTRMFRNPKNFEFRQFSADHKITSMLQTYAAMLNSVGVQTTDDIGTAAIAREVVRWYLRLPQYAKVTSSASPLAKDIRDVIRKAADPSVLLFESLPDVAKQHASTGVADPMRAIRQAMAELSTTERHLRNRIVGMLGVAFSISGDLVAVRHQLMRECSDRTNELIDFKLKAFVLRCADAGLTDERWLESIASLLTQKPLDSWEDTTPTLFESEARAMATRFRKWVGLMLHKGKQNAAPFARFLSVSVLDGSGQDRTEIVPTTPQLVEESAILAKAVLSQAHGDPERAVALLATALAALAEETDKSMDQGKLKHA